jgi:hypothetical protein
VDQTPRMMTSWMSLVVGAVLLTTEMLDAGSPTVAAISTAAETDTRIRSSGDRQQSASQLPRESAVR